MSASMLRSRRSLGMYVLLALGFGLLAASPAFSQKAPQVKVGTVLKANLPARVAGHRHTLQWERCRRGNCRKIRGATSSRYRTRKADAGHGIALNVAQWVNGRKQATTMLIATSVVSATASVRPTRTIKGYYDQGFDQLRDWNSYKAYGFNLVVAGIDPRLLRRLKANGASAWVQPNVWSGCGYEFSTSQALSRAKRAVATKAVSGFYVADEPSTWGCPSAPSRVAALTATLHAHFPGIPTIIATYDATVLAAFAHSADEFALDIYPCQNGSCNYSAITTLATAADHLHLKYVGVPQAFGGDGRYDLPTASELRQIIHTWKATKELGYVVYAFSAVGMPSSTWLQNDPALLSTIAAN
jgi:hypothetical protein